MEKPVFIKSHGERLAGYLHLPERRRGLVPAVVFLHGFTGSKAEFRRSFVRMARALQRVGIASLRFDFRGSGDSEGEFSAMTPTRELQDAREALRFVRRQPGIDPKRVGIVGLSLGGMIAAYILGEDRLVKTGVLWNPVSDPQNRHKNRLTPMDRRQLKEMGFVDMDGWALGQAFLSDMKTFNPLKAIASASCPILIVQASGDQTVPPSSAHAYKKALRKSGQEAAIHLVNGADHCFSSILWDMELIAVTLEWMRTRLA